MLVQVAGDPGSRQGPLVHPEVEPLGGGDLTQDAHRSLGESPELGHFGRGEVGIVGDVPVRADHDVTGVVRVEVQHTEDLLPSGEDKTLVRR